MRTENASIEAIVQKDNYTFSIKWKDGLTQIFHLNNLQKCCPCAGCAEKKHEQREAHPTLTAKRLQSIGRYAIKIEFSEGCSSGIYDYDLLRKIGQKIG